MAKIKIAVDSGHGSNTPGKRTAPFKRPVDTNGDGVIDVKKGEQYKEHIADTGVANLLYSELLNRGYDVIKTGFNDANGKDDPDESLSSRQKRIKNERCALSVSCHFNASAGDGMTFNSAAGVGIYVHDKYYVESKALADLVLKELGKGTRQTVRGIWPQSLALCNCKTMGTRASILCELAFMTNEHEAQVLMANTKFWAECAVQIADGIDNYISNVFLKKPLKTATQRSSENDIMWLQNRINKALKGSNGFIPLVVDGNYGPLTKQAVSTFWEFVGWNKDHVDTGWRAGKKTIIKLDELT